MSKGDVIKVLLDTGAERIIEADAAGREVSFTRNDRQNLITVEVRGRAGTLVRTVEFKADRVVLLEEIPK